MGGGDTREHVDLLAGGRVHQRLHYRPEPIEDEWRADHQERAQALGVVLRAEVQEGVRDARIQVAEAKAMKVRNPDPLLDWRPHQPDGLCIGTGLRQFLYVICA